MCGIFGCILRDGSAAPIIHAALKRLEYRGYDSVGEATIQDRRLFVKKDAGKIDDVHAVRNLDDLPGRIGIGHTRWATHGAPSQVNAHPHFDCSDPAKIAVVHNGIIENFAELRKELEDKGHIFKSKTDTEVIAHLIEEGLRTTVQSSVSSTLETAVMGAVKRLQGSYALAVVSTNEPDKIICARNESPLVLGIAKNSYYFASDIPAFLPLTNKVVYVENGELVILSDKGFKLEKVLDGSTVTREAKVVEWTPEMAEK